MPSIVVDHKGRVVLGFTVLARDGLVTRAQPSIDFRILRFWPDGKLDSSLSLPTHEKGMNSIYLSDTDQIIARVNDNIEYLPAGDGNLKEGLWRTLCTQCGLRQSPTRRTLILIAKDADPPLTIVRFSPQLTLRRCGKATRLLQSADDKIQNYTQFITDEFVYFHNWEPGSGYFTYRWPPCDYEHRIELGLPATGRYTILNDDTFLAYPSSKHGKGEDLEVLSPDGRVKFRPTMQNHESAAGRSPVKASERGNAIAVDLLTIRGRNDALDMAGHVTARRIAVYDIEARKELASIPISLKLHHFEFDLSPDGHRLAILEDDQVRVVDLPGTENTN